MNPELQLLRIAEAQHGAASLGQAREAGLGWEARRRRFGSGAWNDVNGEAFRVTGAPSTREQDLMAAVLAGGPGAVVSHRAAAALWQVPGFLFGDIDVTRWRHGTRRDIPGVRSHWTRRLPPHHVTEVNGIPVTTLPRTLFDLAATERPARLERALDTVCSRSPAVLGALHDMLEELGGRGRTGTAVMRGLLACRPVGTAAPASGLEARVMRILEDAGEPPLERQVDVGGHEWIGRVDFVDRSVGLLIEIDSFAHHSSKLDRERDRRRDEALYGAGCRLVIRIADEDVWRRPWEVLERIRAARRQLSVA